MLISSEYTSFKSALDLMLGKLQNSPAPLATRTAFVTWIGTNLSSTLYPTTTAAINAYDSVITLGNSYYTKYASFFNDMVNWTKAEFLDIYAPALGPLPTLQTSGSCADTCMNFCEDSLDDLDSGYADAGIATSGGMQTEAQIEYWQSYQVIVSQLNFCLGGC